MRLVALLIAASAPAWAANSISDEVSVNRTQATPDNPRAGYLADSLNASFELNDQWTLQAGAMVTFESATQAAGGFPSSGGAVGLLTLGADWEATENFTVGADVEWSPQSTQEENTLITLGAEQDNALLRSSSSDKAVGLDFAYDTTGDSDLEFSFNAGITASQLDATQSIARVANPVKVRDYCRVNKCLGALKTAIDGQPFQLGSARFSAAATAIAWQDTDFTLIADYFGYSDNPASVGYFSLATAGHGTMGGGNGVPIGPLRFLVRPEIVHRFGDFSARLWVQAGQYVEGTGGATRGGGVKLQYKASTAFRLWLTLGGQTDTDESGQETKSGSVALGAGYKF